MFTSLKSDRILKTPADLARILGLEPNADPAQISREFEARTNFETVLAIEERRQTVEVEETWELRITRALPRPRIEMRLGGRGTWTHRAADVPEGIRQQLRVRVGRNGEMETTRSWGAWQRLDWIGTKGRQLKSRSGEIHAVLAFEGVVRETGRRQMNIRIEPLVDDDMQAPAPVKLTFPCSAASIAGAVSQIRAACMPFAA